MHTRHLVELVGQEDPETGLTVRGYGKPFDFEYQVAQHLAMARRQWPEIDEKDQEHEIRQALATGNAWLHYDTRFDVGNSTESMHVAGAGFQGWRQASLFESSDAEMA